MANGKTQVGLIICLFSRLPPPHHYVFSWNVHNVEGKFIFTYCIYRIILCFLGFAFKVNGVSCISYSPKPLSRISSKLSCFYLYGLTRSGDLDCLRPSLEERYQHFLWLLTNLSSARGTEYWTVFLLLQGKEMYDGVICNVPSYICNILWYNWR